VTVGPAIFGAREPGFEAQPSSQFFSIHWLSRPLFCVFFFAFCYTPTRSVSSLPRLHSSSHSTVWSQWTTASNDRSHCAGPLPAGAAYRPTSSALHYPVSSWGQVCILTRTGPPLSSLRPRTHVENKPSIPPRAFEGKRKRHQAPRSLSSFLSSQPVQGCATCPPTYPYSSTSATLRHLHVR